MEEQRNPDGTVNIHVRNMDARLHRRLRILSIEQGIPIGELISAAVAEYLARYPGRVRQLLDEQN